MSRLLSLFLVITITFVMMKALPGDPFNEEQALPLEIHKALREHYGLNESLPSQYIKYLKGIFFWDLGPSFRYKDLTVNQIIKEGFPVSALLGLEALIISIVIGISLGLFSAFYQGKFFDRLIFFTTVLVVSIPSFMLGSLLQLFIGYKLGWLPIARWETFSHSILPALSLAALPAAFIARMTRGSLLEVISENYIKTARSKGLTNTRIYAFHALRNAIVPVVSYLGPVSANILFGSFVIEKIYAIPGLGEWFVNSVLNRDYTVIMGLTVFYSIFLCVILFFIDIFYGKIDPRIRIKS